MELKEVLAQVPGLTKRFVYYLESRGYIRPAKVWKERISRRKYGGEDVQVLRAMWRYYQRGYSLQGAYDLYTRSQQVVAYAGFPAPPRCWPDVLERLKGCPEVAEACAVYATTLDLLVKARAPEVGELHHTLIPLLVEAGVSGPPTVWMAKEWFRRKDAGGENGMLAYVLMKVPGKSVEEVMNQLQGLQGVVEASVLYGESDIIAKVHVASQEELDALVMERIHSIPAVESTRTFIAVGRFHWSRER